jgi:D-threo-aldose 1-dehydrogenase
VTGLKRRQVGQTAVLVTELGFGGGPVGNLYSEMTDEQAAAAMDRAWAAGIRYFDTAPHYGLGLSERRMGAALCDRPGENFVLSTKVGRVLEPNPEPTGSDLAAEGFAVPDDLQRRWDFSADGVRRSLEESLQRLGADRVHVVYVHDPDGHVDEAISGAIPELIRMRDEGMIGAVGVGMNQWQAPLRMVRETDLDVVMPAGGHCSTGPGSRCWTSARPGAWRSWPPRRTTRACWPRPSRRTTHTSTTVQPGPNWWPGPVRWLRCAPGTA